VTFLLLFHKNGICH